MLSLVVFSRQLTRQIRQQRLQRFARQRTGELSQRHFQPLSV